MNKKDKEALKKVIKELKRRLPSNSTKGFLAEGAVTKAIEYLTKRVEK